MPDTSLIVSTIAVGHFADQRGDDVSQLDAPMPAGREVDGLDKYQVVSFGRTVNGARFPDRWWPRLAKAIETGAFDYMSAHAIVDVMIEHDRP